jgi:hypothetical protein
MAIDPAQKEIWLQEFHMNGFVVLKDFLPRELVARMYDELSPLLESEHRKETEAGWTRGRAPFRLALDIGPYADLMRGALADDRYRNNPVIEELVESVMGKWRKGWTQVEVPWNGSVFMPWHSDQTPKETPDLDGPHEIVRVTYNIPLVDFTWSSGATEFLPGTHWLPRSFLVDKDLRALRLHPIRLDLRIGDAVLRDGNALHRGTPNLTDRPRPMLDQTYKKVASS